MAAERTVNFCGIDIVYTLERKKVKNINLRIHPNGEVYVSAAANVPPAVIDAFVVSKGGFITSARKRFSEYTDALPAPKKYVGGERFEILGRELRLAVIASADERVLSDETFLYLYVRDVDDFARKQRLFADWLRRRAEKLFGETVNDVYARLQRFGVPYPTVKIKDMKSRWGSCMPSKGVITLNLQLMKAPPACIEYVVVHEFAHFVHPDHSPAFHAFVASVLPDWQARNQRLKQVVIVK